MWQHLASRHVHLITVEFPQGCTSNNAAGVKLLAWFESVGVRYVGEDMVLSKLYRILLKLDTCAI